MEEVDVNAEYCDPKDVKMPKIVPDARRYFREIWIFPTKQMSHRYCTPLYLQAKILEWFYLSQISIYHSTKKGISIKRSNLLARKKINFKV